MEPDYKDVAHCSSSNVKPMNEPPHVEEYKTQEKEVENAEQEELRPNVELSVRVKCYEKYIEMTKIHTDE